MWKRFHNIALKCCARKETLVASYLFVPIPLHSMSLSKIKR